MSLFCVTLSPLLPFAGYLGGDKSQWPAYLEQQRQLYARFVQEMVTLKIVEEAQRFAVHLVCGVEE